MFTRELRQELFRAFASLELNADTSDEEQEDKDNYGYEKETTLYDSNYDVDADDVDESDAYYWPDPSAIENLMSLPDVDSSFAVALTTSYATNVPELDENENRGTDKDKSHLVSNGSLTNDEQDSAEKKKKKKKKNRKKKRNCPAVEDDLFEEQVQDLEILERVYDP